MLNQGFGARLGLLETAHRLKCVACGARYDTGAHRLFCSRCERKSLLVSDYEHPLEVQGADNRFESYRSWLPYRNVLDIPGPEMSIFVASELGREIGLDNLWVLVSGYSRRYGSSFLTGTFKECEAIGVLNRVREETNKMLVVSSAGNAGRAFLELGARYNEPAIIIVPESARPMVTISALPERAPLLILLRDAIYLDAVRLVDRVVERFGSHLVREGGCYNVARRDSMAVPFLRAVQEIGQLPDRYVQAVGSGTGAIAAWEAANRLCSFGQVEIRPMKLLLVQNAPFSPMVDAWEQGSRIVPSLDDRLVRKQLTTTYAKVLSNATPPYGVAGGVYDALVSSGGAMCRVLNNEIIAAQELAASILDFEPCNASSAALAGLIRSVSAGVVGKSERILLHFTGGGLRDLVRDFDCAPYGNSLTAGLNDDEIVFAAIASYLDRIGPLCQIN